ncbi:MAG: hypothetical protein A2014_11380 [Spirochaetes bacterium GWF1_49_6]|nr:MAG: hypothetical protein A2014_11380 [Spirochaetes bacterium GWF1_49_6]
MLSREYLTRFPNDQRVVLLLAKIYEEWGQGDKALEVFELYNSVFKDKKEFMSRLASSTIEHFKSSIEELDEGE